MLWKIVFSFSNRWVIETRIIKFARLRKSPLVTDYLMCIVLEASVKPARKKKAKPDRIIMNGFVYHTSVVRHNPAVRYLVCSKYLSAGCRGRAILPINANHNMLRITQPHNHPPDNTVEDKFAFLSKLKLAVQNAQSATPKRVFDEMMELYPSVSGEFTYESLRSSLRRWRKEAKN